MGKRKSKKLENSWVDVGSEDDEKDSLNASTSSKAASEGSTILKPLRRSDRETRQKQPGKSWASDFIMPALDKEMPSPQKRSMSSQVRKRTKAKIQAEDPILESRSSSSDKILDHASRLAESTFSYLLSLLGRAFLLLKTPLSFALAIYLLIGILTIAQNVLTAKVSTALTPICRIPGVSWVATGLCSSPVQLDFTSPNAPQPEFDELMKVQNRFEELLSQSGDDYAIPAFMKQSQLAMRDVREVVRFSQLHSKNELLFEFNTFIDAASQTSWDLETFNSHVGRTVDKVLITARWTQRTLDDISGPNTTRSALGSFVDTILAPFQPIKFTEDVVLDQYIKHSDAVQCEISDLLVEAQAVFALLRSLEETLDAIHGIAVRDTQYAEASREEVLALLWTKLGGNSRQVNKFEKDLTTLKKVAVYGQAAYTNIAAAVLKLQAMSAEIDQLKERLVSVDAGPGRPQIPLSLHLENIQSGVERLEEARAYTRDKRNRYSQQIMDKARGAYGDPTEPLLQVLPARKGIPKG
ncbi:hypothetical protein MMC10_003434 [Thelotrema lepadinum]|nr:hypothetical protein [Thelotrema lepadinum]